MQARIFLVLLNLLSLFSLRAMHRLGWFIGRLFILISNREQKNTDLNLRICFPEIREEDHLALRERSLEQAGRTFTELAAVWLWPIERVLGLVRQVSGEEHLQRREGQGLIVLAPHLGCWEIIGYYLATKGKLTNLYRPPKMTGFGDFIKAARSRNGAELVPTDAQGVKKLYKALQAGEMVGILPDQEPDSNKGAVFAPFFGTPALTMLLVTRLVRKTGVRVVFCYAERMADSSGFHIHFIPAPQGMDSEEPETAAKALNQGVEHCVRQTPDQYQWTYRRFKTRPDGGVSPYRVKKPN
jgi:KDO2-lipid IV(A) lauroyltransferase